MVKEFAVRWTVSRGQDTYGYNICTIVGEGIKGRCMGGGYDMLGTSLAQVTMALFPEWFDGTREVSDDTIRDYYGLRRTSNGLHLNGACGVECVERVLRDLIGVRVEWEYSRDRKGRIKDKSGLTISWG